MNLDLRAGFVSAWDDGSNQPALNAHASRVVERQPAAVPNAVNGNPNFVIMVGHVGACALWQ